MVSELTGVHDHSRGYPLPLRGLGEPERVEFQLCGAGIDRGWSFRRRFGSKLDCLGYSTPKDEVRGFLLGSPCLLSALAV